MCSSHIRHVLDLCLEELGQVEEDGEDEDRGQVLGHADLGTVECVDVLKKYNTKNSNFLQETSKHLKRAGIEPGSP